MSLRSPAGQYSERRAEHESWSPSPLPSVVRLLQMRPDEVVDLTTRDLALEPTDDAPVLHEDEGGGTRDAEPGHESGVTVHVELQHGETALLGDLHPRHEALHAPRCAGAVPPHEHQRRPGRSCRSECVYGLGRRLHAEGVPWVAIRETLRGVSARGRTGTL